MLPNHSPSTNVPILLQPKPPIFTLQSFRASKTRSCPLPSAATSKKHNPPLLPSHCSASINRRTEDRSVGERSRNPPSGSASRSPVPASDNGARAFSPGKLKRQHGRASARLMNNSRRFAAQMKRRYAAACTRACPAGCICIRRYFRPGATPARDARINPRRYEIIFHCARAAAARVNY